MIAQVTPMSRARAREVVTLAGRVTSIEVQPSNVAPSLCARISDGTGVVEAVFLGRRDVPGITPGALVTVSGRLNDGRQIYNPRFELRS